jgi:U4/U6.U5 tri-snRNP-associated protein 3
LSDLIIVTHQGFFVTEFPTMSRRDDRDRRYGRNSDHADNETDVESFRSRKRNKERSLRHDDDDGHHGQVKKYDGDGADGEPNKTSVATGGGTNRQMHGGQSSSQPPQSRDYASEREERMARLRQQLKEDDDDLAAMDQGGGGGGDFAGQTHPKPQEEIIKVNQEELEGMDEDEQMKRLLGFDGFGSTKGKAVEDNHASAARGVAAKNKARKYRQYMNRKNGFNRPLEKMN